MSQVTKTEQEELPSKLPNGFIAPSPSVKRLSAALRWECFQNARCPCTASHLQTTKGTGTAAGTLARFAGTERTPRGPRFATASTTRETDASLVSTCITAWLRVTCSAVRHPRVTVRQHSKQQGNTTGTVQRHCSIK